MGLRKISYRNFARGLWIKGPTEVTPAGALRRATNLYPLRSGVLRSRSGGVEYFQVDAHSLTKFNNRRYVGFGTSLQSGTTPGSFLVDSQQVGGGGPIVTSGNRLTFMEIPAQFLQGNPNQNETLGFVEKDFLFVADGARPIKIDTNNLWSDWGIASPTNLLGMTVAAATDGTSNTKTIDLQNAVSGTVANQSGGTAVLDTTRRIEGTGSLRITVPKDGMTTYTKAVALDLTLFTDGVTSSGDETEDYIAFYIHVDRPKHVKNIQLTFFVGPGAFTAGNFAGDPLSQPPWGGNGTPTIPGQYGSYTAEFKVETVKQKKRKNLIGLGDLIPTGQAKHDLQDYLKKHPKSDQSDLSQQQLLNENTFAVAANTWTKITMPKALFQRQGQAHAAGYTWANVLGYQLAVESEKQGAVQVWVDNMTLDGGVGTKGDYLWTITFLNNNTGSRSNPPTSTDGDGNTVVTMFGPVTLDRRGAVFSAVPNALVAGNFANGRVDPQVTHIEFWRTIGNGGSDSGKQFIGQPVMFRAAKFALTGAGGTTTLNDNATDYIGMYSLGGSTYLDPTLTLDLNNAPPPATLTQAVYHAPSGRVFALDSAKPSRIYFSPPGMPESLGSEGFIEPSTPDDPMQRLVVWNDIVYAFSQKRLFQISGIDQPFLANDVVGSKGTIYPYSVHAVDGGIMYVATDGIRIYDGAIAKLVADDALAPLFRGSGSDGYAKFLSGSAPTPAGPVASYGRGEYLLSDGINYTLVYDLGMDAWRIISVPCQALYHEKDTTIVLASFQAAGQPSRRVNALEGDTTTGAELGGLAGEVTTDPTGGSIGLFEVETAAGFMGAEEIGTLMMVFIEAYSAVGPLTVNALVDGVAYQIGILVGQSGKARYEYNVNLPGTIASVRLSSTGVTVNQRLEISAIELLIYDPTGN